MAPDVPVRQVNNILHNLRGEHFRHARNVQGKSVSSPSSLSSYVHNQPTLPFNLIYPTQTLETSRTQWVPGPSPPKSWRSPSLASEDDAADVTTNTPAWRARALSLLFSADATPPDGARPIYPEPSRTPPLTLLCLQLLRAVCPGPDLTHIAPFIPPHLRRTLARHAAVHAPLSQTELAALCGDATHIDSELVVVGPRAALRPSALRTDEHGDDAWDAQDTEPPMLRSLAVVSSPLSTATVHAFPPTITHLVLVNIPHRIPLARLPTICPLVVLLDVSFNAWLHSPGPSMLEEVEWTKLQRLEVLGVRACPVTPKLLLELNRGRWGDVKVIR